MPLAESGGPPRRSTTPRVDLGDGCRARRTTPDPRFELAYRWSGHPLSAMQTPRRMATGSGHDGAAPARTGRHDERLTTRPASTARPRRPVPPRGVACRSAPTARRCRTRARPPPARVPLGLFRERPEPEVVVVRLRRPHAHLTVQRRPFRLFAQLATSVTRAGALPVGILDGQRQPVGGTFIAGAGQRAPARADVTVRLLLACGEDELQPSGRSTSDEEGDLSRCGTTGVERHDDAAGRDRLEDTGVVRSRKDRVPGCR